MAIPEKYKKNIFYKIFNNIRLNYFKILVFFQKLKIKISGKLIIKLIREIIYNPQKIKIILKEGPGIFLNKITIQQQIIDNNKQYKLWFKKNWPNKKELDIQKNKQKKFEYRPKISIITPVYNPDKKWLESCIDSVLNQTYDNWELCLADDTSTKTYIKKTIEKYSHQDKRIKVVYRSTNGHISASSNSALKLATGEYVALLDHDDDLAPNALYEIINVLNKNPKLDFIYTDEDKVEINGQHVDPFFKPDWSPDMLMSMNYICHLSVIRKKLIDKLGGFRIGYEGSQDYDLFLRITEKTNNIYHLSKILYSWRKIPNSTASVYSVKNYANDASIKSLNDSLKRKKIKGSIKNGLVGGTFRTKYKITGNPLISIIIPTKDKVAYLNRCLNSIFLKTTYKNYEILIVDTGSTENKTLNYYKKINKNKKIKFLKWKEKFNYSSVNNFAVKKAKGEYMLLLNNDTEIISPDWIESMLEHAQRKEIGAVGVKLLYPNKKIQHAGIILGIKGGNIKRGVAGHVLKMFPDIPLGQPLLNSKDIVRNYSAVTAACLMISKKKYLIVGGLDEKFRIAFNDVDFNLKIMEKGYLNVYTPYAKLYHHESISVGTPQQGTRNLNEFQKEINMMIKKWGDILEKDPFYNKNLTLRSENFNIKN